MTNEYGFEIPLVSEEECKLQERIEELEKENAELKHNKKTVVHLADCLEEKMKERIEELEQQIEKMKCCVNCKNYCQRKDRSCVGCHKYSHWKLKEIKEND